MLDVHPPQSTHTWRDFFIHIATICIGLLIAIGLEQSVEFFHHRHERDDARERLVEELQENAQTTKTISTPCVRIKSTSPKRCRFWRVFAPTRSSPPTTSLRAVPGCR